MANSARIDELEKKFSENARRYFAPLANEYRKAGDLDRAIEICRAHLPQQPGHMSGHVVYGQALYESRQFDEAKTVFEAALALDPENLIALRHLGDIARANGDTPTARTWYVRVLDADPRNDEVAGMLAELDASSQEAAAAAPPAPASTSVGWGDINPERGADTPTPAPDLSAESEADVFDAAEPADGAPSEVDDAVSAPAEGSRGAAAEAVKAPASSEPAPTALRGDSPDAALFAEEAPASGTQSLDRMLNDAFAADADTQEMEAPTARSARPGQTPPRLSVELDTDTFAEVDALFDEIAPPRPTGSQRAVPGSEQAAGAPKRPEAGTPSAASGDAFFGDDAGEDSGASSPLPGLETSEFVSPGRESGGKRRDTGSMAVTGLTSFDQPTDEDSSTRAAFVTETMAELYLQQGFAAEALDIYRQLLAKDPDDESLRDRVAQLERGGRTSLSVAAVSSVVIEAAQQRHATRQVRTVRSFFGLIASRRAPHRSLDEESANGAPAGELPVAEAPHTETDSAPGTALPEPLDFVGGLFEDSAVSEEDERAASTLASAFAGRAMPDEAADIVPPSGGPSAGTGGRAAHSGGSELSLDQVFRDPASRNPRKSGAYSFDQFFSDGTPTTAGANQQGNASSGDASESPEGDLEQFTAWLEGLKRK